MYCHVYFDDADNIDNHQYKIPAMFDEYYQGKLNNTKGCEEDDRNDGQDDPQEEEPRFFL